MRSFDEADPKKPHPIPGPRKKGPTLPEALERPPWHAVMDGECMDDCEREEGEHDRHRHV